MTGGGEKEGQPLTAPCIHGERLLMRDPSRSVVDADCRAHDVPNLFVCDGSVFPTSTAVNPSPTIEALAARAADRIREAARGAHV